MGKPFAAQMAEVITLIKSTTTQDAIGQTVRTESRRDVFGETSSVSAQEFHEAARNGLNAQLQVRVYSFEYGLEDTVEVAGVRYGVYRTYRNPYGLIELYLERKGGV